MYLLSLKPQSPLDLLVNSALFSKSTHDLTHVHHLQKSPSRPHSQSFYKYYTSAHFTFLVQMCHHAQKFSFLRWPDASAQSFHTYLSFLCFLTLFLSALSYLTFLEYTWYTSARGFAFAFASFCNILPSVRPILSLNLGLCVHVPSSEGVSLTMLSLIEVACSSLPWFLALSQSAIRLCTYLSFAHIRYHPHQAPRYDHFDFPAPRLE